MTKEIAELYKACYALQEDMSTAELEATLALMKHEKPEIVDTSEYSIMCQILGERKATE